MRRSPPPAPAAAAWRCAAACKCWAGRWEGGNLACEPGAGCTLEGRHHRRGGRSSPCGAAQPRWRDALGVQGAITALGGAQGAQRHRRRGRSTRSSRARLCSARLPAASNRWRAAAWGCSQRARVQRVPGQCGAASPIAPSLAAPAAPFGTGAHQYRRPMLAAGGVWLLRAAAPALAPRWAAGFSSSGVQRWGLEELIVVPPKEGEPPPIVGEWGRAPGAGAPPPPRRATAAHAPPSHHSHAGRGWAAEDLRQKSWDDLHKLWCEERGAQGGACRRCHARGRQAPRAARLLLLLPHSPPLLHAHAHTTTRFVLLKERNRLQSEKLMWKAEGQKMPEPGRISKASQRGLVGGWVGGSGSSC